MYVRVLLQQQQPRFCFLRAVDACIRHFMFRQMLRCRGEPNVFGGSSTREELNALSKNGLFVGKRVRTRLSRRTIPMGFGIKQKKKYWKKKTKPN